MKRGKLIVEAIHDSRAPRPYTGRNDLATIGDTIGAFSIICRLGNEYEVKKNFSLYISCNAIN